MKIALIVLGLLLGGSKVQAATHVYETALGSGTINCVSISTDSGSVQLDLRPTRNLSGRFAIEVWNDDDADHINCKFTTNVSTITSPALNANYGRRGSPRTSWTIAVPDAEVIPVWCRVYGSGTAATAIACATQIK